MRARPAEPRPDASAPAAWSQLLIDAVERPGILSAAYSRFWSYSIGNQLLALFQCHQRKIEPGPIHTFHGWLDLGRHVRRGEKAITLCMPVTVRRRIGKGGGDPVTARVGDGAERQLTGPDGQVSDDGTVPVTVFTYKPHWFVLSQTDGEPYVPTELPEWSEPRALQALGIERIDFHHADGNCQGYALDRQVAVSPIAALPHKTLLHEVGHVVLGHTEELRRLDDHDRTPVNLREVEAECVALIGCESLGLDGAEFCRGYIQHWLGSRNPIPEKSAQRIFKAADAILRAGRPASDPSSPSPEPERSPS